MELVSGELLLEGVRNNKFVTKAKELIKKVKMFIQKLAKSILQKISVLIIQTKFTDMIRSLNYITQKGLGSVFEANLQKVIASKNKPDVEFLNTKLIDANLTVNNKVVKELLDISSNIVQGNNSELVPKIKTTMSKMEAFNVDNRSFLNNDGNLSINAITSYCRGIKPFLESLIKNTNLASSMLEKVTKYSEQLVEYTKQDPDNVSSYLDLLGVITSSEMMGFRIITNTGIIAVNNASTNLNIITQALNYTNGADKLN